MSSHELIYAVSRRIESAKNSAMRSLPAKIENSHYSYHSKYGMRVLIKKFYKWLKGDGKIFPPEVRWIKNNHKNDRIKLPERCRQQDSARTS